MTLHDPMWQAALGQFIEERIGVRLRLSEPWEALAPFVQGRLQALNLPSPASYLRYLRSEPANGAEFVRLVTVCTNGQTSFLRDDEQLRGLCHCAFTLWHKRQRPLQVWSAGCSTGEEPYSLAMLFHDARIPASILATDINADVVQNAKQGAFSRRSMRHVPEDLRQRYFTEQGEAFVIHPQLRQMVTVKQHNLLEEAPLPNSVARWDIILCRNVFIYHAQSTVETIVCMMGNALATDGWLFIGASETLHRLAVPFSPVVVGTRHAYQLLPNTPRAPLPTPSTARDEPAASSWSGVETLITVAAQAIDVFGDATRDFRAGRVEASMFHLRQFLTEQPQHALGWLLMGHLHVHAHDFNQALDAYQRVQEHAPLLTEAHYFQGVVHRKVGELSLAEQSLRRALFLAPRFWPAAYMLAGIYERQNRPSLQRKELMFTLQCIEDKSNEVAWSIPIEGCKALRIDAESVHRTCKNLLKTQS